MNPVTPPQLMWILAACGIVLLVAALAYWRPWRKPEPCCDGSGWIHGDRGWRFVCEKHETRTAGVVGLEDPTPDDDLAAIVDATALCGIRYERRAYLTYVCDRPVHADRLHSDRRQGKVEWYADGDILRDPAQSAPRAQGGPISPGQIFHIGEGETIVNPPSTLGQERLYDAHDMVPYGTSMVEQGCLQARRDFATDRICPACSKVFGAVRA